MKNKIIFTFLSIFVSTFSKASNTLNVDEENTYYGALGLEEPYIRITLQEYLSLTDSPKLILGEGHINFTSGLAPNLEIILPRIGAVI